MVINEYHSASYRSPVLCRAGTLGSVPAVYYRITPVPFTLYRQTHTSTILADGARSPAGLPGSTMSRACYRYVHDRKEKKKKASEREGAESRAILPNLKD